MDAGANSSSNRELQPPIKDRRLSNASSVKSERRRSLPARTSMTSVISEFSLSSSKPDVSDFQVRRRRAAKLTQFFGVNYRELINDVLESLETGLELERKRGTLRAEEVEVSYSPNQRVELLTPALGPTSTTSQNQDGPQGIFLIISSDI